jgi:hypothetical protein
MEKAAISREFAGVARWEARMKWKQSVLGAVVAATFVATVTARSGGAQASDSSNGSVSSSLAGKIDADATNALVKMGAYLRTLKAFQVEATVSTEDVLEDGQKVQMTKTVNLVASRPNKMRVEISNDREPRTFYYDGKSFTLFSPTSRFYATVDAPPTINELITQLDEKYAIDVPFVDLFRWGTPEGDIKDLTGAMDVGPAQIDGVTCEHYLFRQNGADWQIWIQLGDYPLPRKLVITTMTDDARPQHEAVYTWNLAPSFSEEAFAFVPPPDAKKITLVDLQAKGLAKLEKNEKQPAEKQPPQEPRSPRNER